MKKDVEKIAEMVHEIRESQIRMEVDVKYHIKRTDLLEKKVEHVEEHVDKVTGFFSISKSIMKYTILVIAFVAAIIGLK